MRRREEKAKQINVAQFVTVFAHGGTERQLLNLVNGIDVERFRVHLGCFRARGELLELIKDRTIPIRSYPVSSVRALDFYQAQLRFAQYLRRQRIHVLHAHGFYPNVFAIPAASVAGVPVAIGSVRDRGENLTSAQRWLLRGALRLADGIVVNAEAIKVQLCGQGYDPSKMRVIHNGIDLSEYHRAEAMQSSGYLHSELGLEPDCPIVAMIGRVRPVKAVEMFLYAAHRIVQANSRAYFVIVGDDGERIESGIAPYRERIEALRRQLGLEERVFLTGFRNNIAEILKNVSVSVSTSRSEGLSNALLESLAAGVPVVATNVGGNPEIVVNGKHGYIVPSADATGMAEAVVRILSDPMLALRMGEAGRQRIEQRFSLSRMVEQTESYYRSLLARNFPEPNSDSMGFRHGVLSA